MVISGIAVGAGCLHISRHRRHLVSLQFLLGQGQLELEKAVIAARRRSRKIGRVAAAAKKRAQRDRSQILESIKEYRDLRDRSDETLKQIQAGRNDCERLCRNVEDLARKVEAHRLAAEGIHDEPRRLAEQAAEVKKQLADAVRHANESSERLADLAREAAAGVEAIESTHERTAETDARLSELQEELGQAVERVSALVVQAEAAGESLRSGSDEARELSDGLKPSCEQAAEIKEQLADAVLQANESSERLADHAREAAAGVEAIESTHERTAETGARLSELQEELGQAVKRVSALVGQAETAGESLRAGSDEARELSDGLKPSCEEAREAADLIGEMIARGEHQLDEFRLVGEQVRIDTELPRQCIESAEQKLVEIERVQESSEQVAADLSQISKHAFDQCAKAAELQRELNGLIERIESSPLVAEDLNGAEDSNGRMQAALIGPAIESEEAPTPGITHRSKKRIAAVPRESDDEASSTRLAG
jgi:methyl-accepting chemotaxis protein